MNMLNWAHEKVKSTVSKSEPETPIKEKEVLVLTIYDEEIRNIWRAEQEVVLEYRDFLGTNAPRLNLNPDDFEHFEDLALAIIQEIQKHVHVRKNSSMLINVSQKILELEIQISTLHEILRNCIESEILKKDPFFIPGNALLGVRKGWRVTKSPIRHKTVVQTIQPMEALVFAGLN